MKYVVFFICSFITFSLIGGGNNSDFTVYVNQEGTLIKHPPYEVLANNKFDIVMVYEQEELKKNINDVFSKYYGIWESLQYSEQCFDSATIDSLKAEVLICLNYFSDFSSLLSETNTDYLNKLEEASDKDSDKDKTSNYLPEPKDVLFPECYAKIVQMNKEGAEFSFTNEKFGMWRMEDNILKVKKLWAKKLKERDSLQEKKKSQISVFLDTIKETVNDSDTSFYQFLDSIRSIEIESFTSSEEVKNYTKLKKKCLEKSPALSISMYDYLFKQDLYPQFRVEIAHNITLDEKCESFKIEIRKKNVNWDQINGKLRKFTLTNEEVKDLKEKVEKLEPYYRTILDDMDDAIFSIQKELKSGLEKLKATASTTKHGETQFDKFIEDSFDKDEATFFKDNILESLKNSSGKYEFDENKIEKSIERYIKKYNNRILGFKPNERVYDVDSVETILKEEFNIFSDILKKYSYYGDYTSLYNKINEERKLIQSKQLTGYSEKLMKEAANANSAAKANLVKLKTNFEPVWNKVSPQVLTQLWLTGKDWKDLNLLNTKNKTVEGKKTDLDKLITDSVRMVALLAYYKELTSVGLSVNGDSRCTNVDVCLKKFESLYKDVDSITAAHKKARTSNASIQKPVTKQDKFGIKTSDFFLNEIHLAVGPMAHYNFTTKKNMNPGKLKEINEETPLTVLIHNDVKIKSYEAKYTPTAIATDRSLLGEDLKFDGAQAGGYSKEDIENFLKNYELITLARKLIEIEFEYFNHVPKKSVTPHKITNKKVLDMPEDVPSILNYTLSKGEDSITGKVRVNKLYKFRYKVGPVYSLLKQKDYTVTDNGDIDLKENYSGMQVAFGLQYYFFKNDIRRNNPCKQFYCFAGMHVGEKVLENFYTGLGLEFYDGIGICVGTHLAMSERLVNSNGTITVDDKAWKIGFPFISLQFDHAVFTTLFANPKRIAIEEIF